MTANAEAGYWNGAKPPYGYKTAVAAVLRNKEKKVLVDSEEDAPVVRLIFRLYREGDGSGPMGTKKIVAYLNSHGYSYRGKPFYTSAVEKILKGESTPVRSGTTASIAVPASCVPKASTSRLRFPSSFRWRPGSRPSWRCATIDQMSGHRS